MDGVSVRFFSSKSSGCRVAHCFISFEVECESVLVDNCKYIVYRLRLRQVLLTCCRWIFGISKKRKSDFYTKNDIYVATN